ncbi:RNA polymerase sigma factor ShbA [Micromonospora sp. WMMC273]|uniref:RNA polymerase sigma factor ShbA n=1 Tax=Micromonospora sp. WMMC273 TaxID=3015157 RepID=UPI0022B74C07|nr:RNA polymerase sigma factor ShbA [Micromonospora sp. WMMC273]MCZ7478854.1 RNA polymerase sigma factor ShbA [Micromonospora sp. WMMC273]
MPALDAPLVARAIRRDQEAVEELLRQMRPGLVRYCRARLGRLHGTYTTADDVAQDTCMALLEALPTYRITGEPFAAFAYTIAQRKVADVWRQYTRDRSVPTNLIAEEADPGPGPEDLALQGDTWARLSRLLSKVTPAQREILLLRVGVGLSAEEVAVVVGSTATNVRVQQTRALQRLRGLTVNWGANW